MGVGSTAAPSFVREHSHLRRPRSTPSQPPALDHRLLALRNTHNPSSYHAVQDARQRAQDALPAHRCGPSLQARSHLFPPIRLCSLGRGHRRFPGKHLPHGDVRLDKTQARSWIRAQAQHIPRPLRWISVGVPALQLCVCCLSLSLSLFCSARH